MALQVNLVFADLVSVFGETLAHAHAVMLLETVLSDAKSFAEPERRDVPNNVEDRDRIVIARSDCRNEVRCAGTRSGHSAAKAGNTSIRISSKASIALVRRWNELYLGFVIDGVDQM